MAPSSVSSLDDGSDNGVSLPRLQDLTLKDKSSLKSKSDSKSTPNPKSKKNKNKNNKAIKGKAVPASILSQFNKKAKAEGWSKERKESEKAAFFGEALKKATGADKKKNLEILQDLCEKLGLGRPKTMTQCRKGLKEVHVNIYDYIDYCNGATKKLKIIKNMTAFKEYMASRGYFPRQAAKKVPALRALLEVLVVKPVNDQCEVETMKTSCRGEKESRGWRY